MEITLLLAKMFGAFFVVMSIALFTHKSEWKSIFREVFESRGVSFLLGFIVFVMGMLLVAFHNVWDAGFNSTLVTVFAWITLIKGISFFLLPQATLKKWVSYFLGKGFTPWIIGVFILGMYLMMVGYGVV